MKKIILILAALILLMPSSFAENVWVLCQPDSYVNVRPYASKKHEPNGIMECGWKANTNGKTKKGYLYIDGLLNEYGNGWIHMGYIVYSEPAIITFKTNIYADGRVACWKSIGGERKCWVQPGEVITVYAVSDEWSVTNKGFIKTEYLGVDYNILLNAKSEKGQSYSKPDDLYYEDE